jgi:hypothetical protein
MRFNSAFRFVLAVACGLLTAGVVGIPAVYGQTAVPPLKGEKVHSMGQPQRWKPYAGPALIWDREGTDNGGLQLYLGVYKDLLNPSFGAFGLAGEGYYSAVKDDSDGGFRLFGVTPFFGLQAGADYAIEAKDLDFVMSWSFPWRRSGPLGKGDYFRIDWYPWRNNSFSFGVSIPIFQRWIGQTRPQRDNVELAKVPKPLPPVYTPPKKMREALAVVETATFAINDFTVPFLDMDAETDEAHMEIFLESLEKAKTWIRSTDDLYPNGHTFAAEIEVYHAQLERAFVLAAGVGEEEGKKVAAEARRVLRDQVVFPYNRLLGQRKRRDSLRGFGMRAEEVFGAWLFTSSGVPPTNHMAIMYVFSELIGYWEANRHREKRAWGDSRLVWIPLHYVIKTEETDSQEELNALIEAAVQREFSDANDVHYVINELFQQEFHRMVHAAEDYHVLWIHDYRGRNNAGDPDQIGFIQTVDGYLGALTKRVQEYEKTRKIPVYIINLDQFYYEANDGRLWLTLLEDPLEHEVSLPAKYDAWEERIREAQDALRKAVEASPTLQAGRQRYGDAWLKNKIKVHINNTNITDMSYRSNYLFEWLPFIPDILLRDHRKISFYDVTELDPGKGEAIFTGMGVGEHYSGPTWDDRAILVSGPSLVHLKDEARELLYSQGFTDAQIPVPLRDLPEPDDYDEMLAQLRAKGWNTTAMQVYNATGYGMKHSNMLKGTLYNLMPPGTHMYIPDSLWNSMLWGGMMVGAALRGCWVFPVSPSLANAPSDGLPQMTRANELFTRLVMVQNEMKQEIEEAGGRFHVGIYDADHAVGDALGNIRTFNRGAANSPRFREVFPFDKPIFDFLVEVQDSLEATGYQQEYIVDDAENVDDADGVQKPKLHLKTQFFASGDALSSLIPMKEWKPVVEAYVKARSRQMRLRGNYVDAKALRYDLGEAARPLAEKWHRESTPEQREKSFFFLTVGSHNMDYRGKFMDGEVLVLVAGDAALIAYLDFVSTLAKTRWIENIEQLNELLPAQKGTVRWMSRFVKNAL